MWGLRSSLNKREGGAEGVGAFWRRQCQGPVPSLPYISAAS